MDKINLLLRIGFQVQEENNFCRENILNDFRGKGIFLAKQLESKGREIRVRCYFPSNWDSTEGSWYFVSAAKLLLFQG
jgi:hypothetical protein